VGFQERIRILLQEGTANIEIGNCRMPASKSTSLPAILINVSALLIYLTTFPEIYSYAAIVNE
jgi:hypothetical protein